MPATESIVLRRELFKARVVACSVSFVLPCIFSSVCETTAPRESALWLILCASAAAALPFLHRAPYRSLGIATYAASGWLALAIYGAATDRWPGFAHGIAIGAILGSLSRASRGRGLIGQWYWILAALFAGEALAYWLARSDRPPSEPGSVALVGIALLDLFMWLRLFRPAFELAFEPFVWFFYRIRGGAPAAAEIPSSGPCIVIANHACWFDPLFLAKVIPRPITPMMTSRFYDLPVMRQLMISFGVIPVTERKIKKETPEIGLAIAALERGECLVVFPEGYLRRTEEQPLRRFGRGLWQILQAHPNVPVFACWIEGGWGSFTSYWNGSPTKNKKLDYGRTVNVAVSPAAIVPAETLADHMETRYFLMNLVGAARGYLNLPRLAPFSLPTKTELADEAL
jgi:1-acyl-sn-glycerol-3-phosphate acyltransferase